MPTAADLRAGPAPWLPDPSRAVLLIHDLQRYFVGFFPPDRSPIVPLLANVAALKAAAVDHGIPVVYSAQPATVSREERGLLHDLWGPGMTGDPQGGDFVPSVAPGAGDLVVTKYRYSAFHRTGLAAELAALGRDQLIVCGVFAHIGCLLTACDAYSYDIQPFLVADAVADFSAAEHRMALDYAARRCAVPMLTADLLAGLA